MSVFYLSVCLCTQLTCLSVLYLYILYVCNQATSFDGVVPSGSLPLYFYLFELMFCFLLWKIKYISIYPIHIPPFQFACLPAEQDSLWVAC